jgi:hypothetical protein
MRLIIELSNAKEFQFVRRLLDRLNIRVVQEETPTTEAPSPAVALDALQEIAQRGEVAKLIPDPATWQRAARQDRNLV